MRHLLMRTGAVSNEGGAFHSRDCDGDAGVRQTESTVCPCQATEGARVRRQKVPVSGDRQCPCQATDGARVRRQTVPVLGDRRCPCQATDSARVRRQKVPVSGDRQCTCQATDGARVRRQTVPVSRLGALTATHAWLLMPKGAAEMEGPAEEQTRRVEKQNMDYRKVQRTVLEVVMTDEVSATLLWCGGAECRKKTAQGGQAVQGPD